MEVLAFALALVCPAAPAAPLGAASDDWPQFLGPTRDGVYAGPPLAERWKEGGPPVIWRKEVGAGYSGVAVAAGKVLLLHRVGGEERVECLEAESGKEVWRFGHPTAFVDTYNPDQGPRATPSVADGRVFTHGAEGMLHALDLASGKKLWSVDTRAKFRFKEGYFGAASSPLVEGDRLLLIVGGQDGAGIVALQAETGKTLWTATDHRASHSSPVAATIAGERHALFFTRSGLVDLDPADGRVRFQLPFRARIDQSVNAATPLVIGERVFISASYQCGAALLLLKEGGPPEKLWANDESLSNHYATSVHREGFLYGFDGRQESSPALRSVELGTGKVRWSKDRFGAGTVTLAGKLLVILSEEGELVLARADPESFKPLARASILRGTVRAHPALARGRLYARSGDTLVCVELGPAK